MKNIRKFSAEFISWVSVLLPYIFFVGGVFIALPYMDQYLLNDFFTIDTCLDRGGRWNYELRVCENKL